MYIKNIIFDLGGVILNLNRNLTIEAFKKLGAKNSENLFESNEKIINDFDMGKISACMFRELMKKNLKIKSSNEEFDSAWNAMLLDIPPRRLSLIKQLKNEDYKTFLLSNTNYIHQKYVTNLLNNQNIYSFKKYFEKEYYSNEIGFRKPDKNAYQKIIDDNWLAINKTLFIDDTYECIKGAAAIGLHTIHLTSDLVKLDIQSYIDNIGKISYSQKLSGLRIHFL